MIKNGTEQKIWEKQVSEKVKSLLRLGNGVNNKNINKMEQSRTGKKEVYEHEVVEFYIIKSQIAIVAVFDHHCTLFSEQQ